MPSGLNPGVHVSWQRREPPQPVRIDVPAFIGIAGRGPLDRAGVIESWPQFVALYGDFQSNAFLGYAIRAFFDNGGQRCHVVRVAAPALATVTAGAQPADRGSSLLADATGVQAGAVATLEQLCTTVTTGPQPVDRRSSTVTAVAGFQVGLTVVVRQTGRQPARLVIAAVDPVGQVLAWPEPLPAHFDLTLPLVIEVTMRDRRVVAAVAANTVSWTRPLDARFDLTLPIAAGFGAFNARAAIFDETGAPLLAVKAVNPGRWGNEIAVRVTTALGAEIATRRRTVPDPADRLTLAHVDGLAVGSTVEILQDGVPKVRNEIVGVDPAELAVRLGVPLVGFDLAAAALGTRPIQLRRLTFALSVRERGRLIETYPLLDLPSLAKPQDSPVNRQSRTVRITRYPGTALAWPDPGSPLLDFGEARLWGGRDGIAMLRPRHFTGSSDQPPRGLRLLENLEEPAAIAMPDLVLPPIAAREVLPEEPTEPDPCALCPAPVVMAPPPPSDDTTEASPGFPFEIVLSVQQAVLEDCAARGDRVAVLDPPLGADGAMLDWPALAAWRQRFDSSYGVAYFPWLAVPDPLAQAGSLLRSLPPSGHALGQFARADFDPGRDAPANSLLAWVSDVGRPVEDERHAWLNEAGINAITARPGRGLRIMGARTLSSSADWKQLTVRRLFLRLKRSIAKAMAWAVFEPANAHFERLVYATLEGLLEREWQDRNLAGASPEQAFSIAVNTGQNGDNGEFVVDIGVAPVVPAEFVMLQLVRTLDRLELAEPTRDGGWPK